MRDRGGHLFLLCALAGFLAGFFSLVAISHYQQERLRSQVARVQRDLQALAHAMEGYRVDNGGYIAAFLHSPLSGGSSSSGDPRLLTTPVVYLEQQAEDPFRLALFKSYRLQAVAYHDSASPSISLYPHDAWMAWSYGPDFLTQTGGYRSLPVIIANESLAQPKIGPSSGYNGMRYDPTNGAVSTGDIYRHGGLARVR